MWMHGGSRLHFGYTVRAADNDRDGIGVKAGAIILAGGRISGEDGDAADLSLGSHTIANAAEHRVDGAGVWAPSIVAVSVTSNPGVDGVYGAGDVIEVSVEFDEQVSVEGLPTLTVMFGNEPRELPYRGGSGSLRLAFTTRVWNGDLADTGVVLPENGLAGPAGIKDADGNVAQTDYPAPGRQPRHRVDAVSPRVVGIELVSAPPSEGVYREGDMVSVEVRFDEEVYLVGPATMPIGGLPQVDGASRSATAVASGQRSILFRFSVLPQDATEGVYFGRGPLARPAALAEQWPSIQDRAGNVASPLYSDANRWHGVAIDGSRSDMVPPAVHSVSIASMPRNGVAYGRGELLAIRVLFTEPLQAAFRGSWATIELSLGTDVKTLGTWVGNGAGSATFTHLVTEADIDSDGVSLAGEIHVGAVQDSAGNLIEGESLEFTPFADPAHRVNGKKVNSASPQLIESGPGGGGGRLTFDDWVEVRGAPEFLVGGVRRASRFRPPQHSFLDKDLSRWHIDYEFPSIAEDDFDADGIDLPPDGWADVSFLDARGRPVPVHPHDITVPGSRNPVIGSAYAGVALKPPSHGGASFGEGQTLEFDVVFAEPVTIAGAARLKVGIRELPCLPRNGRHRHYVCNRIIAAGENAQVELARGAFRLLASSIRDDADEVVSGDLSAYAEVIEPFTIDTTRPSIKGLSIASTPAASGTYGAGAVVSVVVRFTEPVHATGSEQLAIVIGEDTRLASLDGPFGTDGLRFSYVVARGDGDSNGLAIPADALRLEGGAITDAAGNPAVLAHSAVGDRSTQRVDGSVTDISTTQVQVRVRAAPAAGLGSPTQVVKSSLTWAPTSTWSGQPRMSYTVEADHPDVLVGRASGRVRLGQGVTNNLRMPCKASGTNNVRLTVSVKGTKAPVAWDVLCRAGVIRVAEVEVFQGPLAGRFGPEGAPGSVDAIEDRQAVLRVHVEHEAAVAPDVAVGLRGAGDTEPLDADHQDSRRSAGKWVSRYLVPLAPAQVARDHGLDVVADPYTHLDAEVQSTPRLNFDALTPKTLPVFKPVFVPVRILNATPDVNARALLKEARSLLPIAKLNSRVTDPFVYEPSAEERSRTRIQSRRLFESLVQWANEESAADEFIIGIALPPAGWQPEQTDHRHAGMVQLVLGEADASELVAVGLGGGMGLQELPCKTLGDPAFPHEGIGAEGSFSFLEGRFITASDQHYDLMSECMPRHISIYSYRKALTWGERVHVAMGRESSAGLAVTKLGGARDSANGGQGTVAGHGSRPDAPAPRSLALSGSVDEHGFWSLFASATSNLPPRTDAPGEFVLTLHDDSGVEMYRQALAAAVGNTSPDLSGTWAVRVPMQPREVHAMRIRDAGGSLLLDSNVHLRAHPSQQMHQ